MGCQKGNAARRVVVSISDLFKIAEIAWRPRPGFVYNEALLIC